MYILNHPTSAVIILFSRFASGELSRVDVIAHYAAAAETDLAAAAKFLDKVHREHLDPNKMDDWYDEAELIDNVAYVSVFDTLASREVAP